MTTESDKAREYLRLRAAEKVQPGIVGGIPQGSLSSLVRTGPYAVPVPGGVKPVAWFDGNQQAFSDAAGLVPINYGLMRRIREPAPLNGYWYSTSDPERPNRDAKTARFDLNATAGGCQLNRTAPAGLFLDSCTVIVSYMARDNAFAGPLMGLFEEATQRIGPRIGSNTVWANTTAGIFFTGIPVEPGRKNTVAITYTPNGVDVKVKAGSTVTTNTWATTLTHTAASDMILGRSGSGYMYGSVSQAMVFASPLDPTLRDAWMAYADAQDMPEAYPDTQVLTAFVGDSIPRSTATAYELCYPSKVLTGIRAAGYSAENYNGAVGGAGVNRIVDPTTGTVPSGYNMFRRANGFYSASRIKNLMFIALGTNNLAAADNSVEFILHGTGSPNNPDGTGPFPGSGLYPLIDAAVAAGWRVVVIVPGPRSDNAAFQATYNLRRGQVCDDLVANGPAHGAIVRDTRTIVGFGQDGDSNNTTNYSGDKIHPLAPGHALLAPYAIADALAALAA